jgi:hypothetical protein
MDRKSQTNLTLRALLPAFLIAAAIPGMIKLASQIVAWRTISHAAALGDGLNYWAGPALARQNVAAVFNPPVYSAWLLAHAGVKNLTWSYPPSYLLLVYPLGFLPPVTAVFLFDIMSLAVLAVALESASFLKKRRPTGGGKKALLTAGIDSSPLKAPGNQKFFASFFQKRSSFLLPVLLCPAALENLADGQNGALISALLIAGLTLEDEYPVLGGIMLGLLSVTVFLLARRKVRALAAAAVTALALAGAALAFFGVGAWRGFFMVVAPEMSAGLIYMTHTPHPGPQAMMMSVFNVVREFRAPVAFSYAVQAVAAVMAVCLTWRAAWMGPAFRVAAVLLLSALVTPYLWCYDMIFCAYAVVLLAPAALDRGKAAELIVLAALWLTPGLAVYLEILHLPSLFPLFAAAGLALAWRRQGAGRPAAVVAPA